MRQSTIMNHLDIAEDFLEAFELMAEHEVDAALQLRATAICRAREAGIHDYHQGIHAPPSLFHPPPALLDNWLLGNVPEAIAAARYELLSRRTAHGHIACTPGRC